MSSIKPTPADRFANVEALLTKWLKERRELLSQYTHLAVSLDSDINPTKLKERQRSLCELLVDYVSAGHFEVFHQLISEAESFADGSYQIAEQLMPGIGDTTEVILAYEEKHSSDLIDATDGLQRDLNTLGEVLESRFVLEDQLIAGLHQQHRSRVDATASAE